MAGMDPRVKGVILRLPWLVLGVSLLVLVAALEQAEPGYRIAFQPPFTDSSKGELFFWLVHGVLGVSGAVVVGYALGPLIGGLPGLLLGWARRAPGVRWALIGGTVLLLFAALVACRSLFLLDMAVTDDENAVEWGGRVLASKATGVSVPPPIAAFRGPFQMFRGGRLMSFDWPGGLLFSAFATSTGLGAKLYAAVAAVAVPAVALAAWRWWGASTGCVVGAWALWSPAIFLLSLTTHAQLLSRSLLALALAALATAETSEERRWFGLVGLFWGGAFLTRPIESTVVAIPFLARAFVLAWRERSAPLRAWTWFVLGVAPSVVLFALFNRATTGIFWLPGRFTPEAVAGSSMLPFFGYWDRVGQGVGYSSLMVTLFVVGLPGVVGAIAGFRPGRRGEGLALAGGLGLGLLLSMAHDNHGVHGVGPIHQAEVSLALLLLAARGAVLLGRKLQRTGLSRASLVGMLAGYLVLAHGSWSLVYLGALHRQALNQKTPYEALRALPLSVVLAPRLRDAYEASPALAAGSWVRHWAPWAPDFSSNPIILRDLPGALEAAQQRFPERAIYRLTFVPSPAPGEIVRLSLLASPGGSSQDSAP